MEISCSTTELLLFQRISETAAQMKMEVYVIGGFVRDKIIGRSTSDIDFVCTGNAIELADEVAVKYVPRPMVSVFRNFGTAHFKIQDKDDHIIDIEFVGARKESYRSVSRKPDIVP